MAANRKAKGTKAERELVHFFWDHGWAAMRAAGSGSMGHPSPDVLAGNGIRRLAIECKSIKDSKKYFTKDEISQLKEFAQTFGAEPWTAVRFDKKDWYFLMLEDLEETDKFFVVSESSATTKGLLFSELIGN